MNPELRSDVLGVEGALRGISMGHAHPIIAALYDRMAESAERAGLGRLRAHLVGSARGNVLEVGAGTGRNFGFYRRDVVEAVTAVEPDPHMRRRAEARAREAAVAITLLEETAEHLSFPSVRADTIVATLVFCSFDDPRRASEEMRRVLAPGGRLILIEHIRSPENRRARLQDAVTPIWRRIAANCHPNRPTIEILREVGFDFHEQERLSIGAPWTQPVVAGYATLAQASVP